MKILCFFNPTIQPDLPTMWTILLFILPHLTSSFMAVIITAATRGHHLTTNINMGRDKLLSQMAHMAAQCFFHTVQFSTLHSSIVQYYTRAGCGHEYNRLKLTTPKSNVIHLLYVALIFPLTSFLQQREFKMRILILSLFC